MTTGNTTDHFSPVARQYAGFRPVYPEALFDWLSSSTSRHNIAWDCGAGSGQATRPLAGRFKHVLASDISAAQLAAAPSLANVEYRVAPAEASGLPDRAVDLVVVAQAMHWFDLSAFHAEVQRVLKPDGLIAVWGYNRLHVGDTHLQSHLDHFYDAILGPYWPPERVHVETGYLDLAFPYHRIPTPKFSLSMEWTLEHLLGYLRSWSATERYRAANGHDPVSSLACDLMPRYDASHPLRIEWPLFLLAGRPSGTP